MSSPDENKSDSTTSLLDHFLNSGSTDFLNGDFNSSETADSDQVPNFFPGGSLGSSSSSSSSSLQQSFIQPPTMTLLPPRINDSSPLIDTQYLQDDETWLREKNRHLETPEQTQLARLVIALKSTDINAINRRFVRNILETFFSADYIKQLTFEQRKIAVSSIFAATVIRHFILHGVNMK
jgi:hypothetical protein